MRGTFLLLALALSIHWSGLKAFAQNGDLFVVVSARNIGNVIVVAKNGARYKSIQNAIDSIIDAQQNNPYLVVVGPGLYTESVTLKSNVHLQGSGKGVTTILSDISSEDYPPTEATVKLAERTSVRDLTLWNGGTGKYNVALLAPDGTRYAVVSDVDAAYFNFFVGGESDYGIFLNGNETDVTLRDVTATGRLGTSANYGLFIRYATAALYGGTFTGTGGTTCYGIANGWGILSATNITAIGENGTHNRGGLYSSTDATSDITHSVLLGENFSVATDGGTHCTLTHTRLQSTAGNCTCIAVSEGATFYPSTCP